MEIKGDDFLKRIQVQQEKDELESKLNELEEVENTLNKNRPNANANANINTYAKAAQEEPSEQELGNIMLETATSNEENKKKYLMLGLVLVVLFLLTIIVIRLLTDSSKEDPFTSDKTQSREAAQVKEDSNIEENFQKIMNDRIKKNDTIKAEASEDKLNSVQANENIKEETTSVNNEILDETIRKIEEKKKVEKVIPKKVLVQKPIVKKEIKIEPKKSVKDLVQSTSTSTSSPKGYFVQVGAFTKKPSNSYINKIRNASLKYKVHQVEIKGKLYNKVLIGPYSSKALAKQNIENIKKKLNISSAYVLKF